MCLTIPKEVLLVNKNFVKLRQVRSPKSLASRGKPGSPIDYETASTIIPVKKGDWVLTQQIVRHGSILNVIIKKISKKQAEEINKLLKNPL